MKFFTILAQSRPGNTTAVSIYSPPASVHAEIDRVIISNTAATAQKYRIMLDNDGTTYDETTSLFWDIEVPATSTIQIEAGWWMDNSAGNLAVRTDLADAFTFTVFGAENLT